MKKTKKTTFTPEQQLRRSKQRKRHESQEALAKRLTENPKLRYSLRRARSAAKQIIQGGAA
jgi:hypothetical protein